jgi:hypothetical protein
MRIIDSRLCQGILETARGIWQFDAAKSLPAIIDFRTDGSNEFNVDLKVRGAFVDTLDEEEPPIANFDTLSAFITGDQRMARHGLMMKSGSCTAQRSQHC